MGEPGAPWTRRRVVGDLVFTVRQHGQGAVFPLSPLFILPFWHVFEVVCPTEDFFSQLFFIALQRPRLRL